MPEFKSWQSYWIFRQNVMRHARYMFPEDVNAFLESVITTSEKRIHTISSGEKFWRAQLGHEWKKTRYKHSNGEEFEEEVEAPYTQVRMKPSRNKAPEGRVNPKGIPCLYLATDRVTAMAEVRPWIGSFVSVGQFETVKDLKLIDLSVHAGSSRVYYFVEPDASKRESVVWADIDRAFSEPVHADESSADYIPTQIISELFRFHGYDGLVYKSMLGQGFNIALFDIDMAKMRNCFLFEVESVEFKFKETGAKYFLL